MKMHNGGETEKADGMEEETWTVTYCLLNRQTIKMYMED